ncbi:hypothetical protein ACXY9E_14360, partial [Escherichia coli]
DRNRSHWSTSKTPSYTKSVSWQHHPISSLKFDWEWAPVDTILIEVIIPPVESDLVSAENDFLRDSGIGHIQCEPGGASIRRTVTFVGGITADNLLYQLRLMCVSALKLLGEELGDEV